MRIINKAYYFIIGLIVLLSFHSHSQDQKVADSLKIIYFNDELTGIDKLELLRNLAFNEVNDVDLALKYAEELIALSESENNYLYIFRGFYQKGNSYLFAGDLDLALKAFFKSSEAAIKDKNVVGEGFAYMAIADVYSEMGNAKNASNYFTKAIDLLRQTDDTISLASALFNAGDEAFNNKDYDTSLTYFEESGALFLEEDYKPGLAYNLGNIGMVYAEQGKHELALNNINEALAILEDFEDYYAISEYLTYMSDIYLKRNDWQTALNYAIRSLNLAKKHGLKKQLSESNLKLSELYEHESQFPLALNHYKDFIAYRDTLINIENIEKAADLRTNYEVSQKQIKVDLLNQQKRTQRVIVIAISIALVSLLIIAFGLIKRNKYIKKTNAIIAVEKDRSDNLLLNILPEETAEELKQYGKVKARKFEAVTVLFTDFKGFTQYAENLLPEELVESVDFYFSKFDAIMEAHGLEKIKTIGDAYMCVAGIHMHHQDHAHKMVEAALEIVDFVKEAKTQNGSQARFDIRIGINTGPVVAGIVGTKKFAYDIWGDAVNIASRMESNSEPGKINISENTYSIIKDTYDCDFRGKLKVKNRSDMNMYFVKTL
jgi:adenylate cyclase